MANRLPDLLTSAKQKAEAYTVRPTPKGYVVWAFLGWPRGGWTKLATETTSEQAWVNILDRLGLIPPDEKPEPPKCIPAITFAMTSYDDGWTDWA